MTVKELKEELNKFDDNLIVMIPRKNTLRHVYFPYIGAGSVCRGINEYDGCIFIEDGIQCETCVYDDTDMNAQPCCSCIEGANWEKK